MNISSAPPEALTFNLESVSNLFHNALKTPIAALFLDVDQFSAESSKDQFVIYILWQWHLNVLLVIIIIYGVRRKWRGRSQ